MPDLSSAQFPLFAVRALCALFLAITFLQSGIDKVVDYQGNLDYFTGHFKKSFLGRMVKHALVALLVLEILAGALCAVGFLQLMFANKSELARYGFLFSGLTFCALLFGQRVNKDYVGAANLVPYFLVSIIGLWTTAGTRVGF